MRTFALLLMLPFVVACATSSIPTTRLIDTACSWVKPLTATPADTFETRQQILAHDLAVAKNCPKSTP
ncbi:hypothetical protein WK39_28055 [Burkholderia cepacia]|nr:hypothetical protein WK39_28055 [Burkholderia cepacia]KVS65743.1 hypothetical protein WK40_12365 [Burkholderia cepacia]KWO60437.1 hypothetical protein WT98_30875 [Burkholderia territorii]